MQSIGFNEKVSSQQLPLLSDFETECVALFSDIVVVVGVQRSIGQIYGLLFASAKPLSFTDIVERLGISKGSASQGLQLLRELGAVRSTSARDQRREWFEPELGLRKLVGALLRDRVEPFVTQGEARMKYLRDCAARAKTPAEKKSSLRRVRQLETWRRQLWFILPVLKTIIGPARA